MANTTKTSKATKETKENVATSNSNFEAIMKLALQSTRQNSSRVWMTNRRRPSEGNSEETENPSSAPSWNPRKTRLNSRPYRNNGRNMPLRSTMTLITSLNPIPKLVTRTAARSSLPQWHRITISNLILSHTWRVPKGPSSFCRHPGSTIHTNLGLLPCQL